MFSTKEERMDDFVSLWTEFAPEESDHLITGNTQFVKYLEGGGFFTAPASTKYHGAYEGGLYDHCRCVFNRLNKLTHDNNLSWQRDESPFIIGMFHDLCKCDQYKKVGGTVTMLQGQEISAPAGYHYEFDANTVLKGHAPKSIMILSQFITLTEEEMLCIRFHMGAYETDDWDAFDKAIRKCPNVLWTHMADMLASKVDDV